METIVLKYKNFEVLGNGSNYELRKNGNVLMNMVESMDHIFAAIHDEEEKEEVKSYIREKLNQEKENTISFLNSVTKLNVREISYQEMIQTRLGFTQKGFLINEGNVKRLLTKEELIDYLYSFYNKDFKKYFEYTNA